MKDASSLINASAIFHRETKRDYPVAVRAQGLTIWDSEGKSYLDACCGAISVASIGHCVPEINDALKDQLDKMAWTFSGAFANEPAEQLAKLIVDWAPLGITKAVFFSGGSEAVEAAIKMARNYHFVAGRAEKTIVVGRRRSYHGATILTMSAGDVPLRNKPYRPYMLEVGRVVEPYCYRCPFDKTYPACGLLCATDLERVIDELGADRISAFVAEPIVAAAGCGIAPPEGYYQRIREICDQNEIVFIADEVVTGFGRTGKRFGIDHWSVRPDIIAFAKGVAGGYVPLAGLAISSQIFDTFADGDANFVNGLTFQDHPLACAAGLAVLRYMEQHALVENASKQGVRLFSRLEKLKASFPIGDIRGKGLLVGVELLPDTASREAFDPALRVAAHLVTAAERHGLLIYPGANADGFASDQILISPPLTVTAAEIDEIVDRFEKALHDTYGWLARLRRTTLSESLVTGG